MGDIGAVAARVHANPAADGTGHADGPLQAGQSGLDRLASQSGQRHRSTSPDHRALDVHRTEAGRIEQHADPREASVGHQEVGSPSDHQHRQPGGPHSRLDHGQIVLARHRDHDRGRTPHPVGGQGSERSIEDDPLAERHQQLRGRAGWRGSAHQIGSSPGLAFAPRVE